MSKKNTPSRLPVVGVDEEAPELPRALGAVPEHPRGHPGTRGRGVRWVVYE